MNQVYVSTKSRIFPRPASVVSILLTLLSILCFSASSVNAASYYADAVNGSDSAAGSSTAPFKTLAKGQSVLNNGDTLYLRAGSYGTLTDKGIHSSFVTYKAVEGASAVVGNVTVNTSAYVRIEGLEITGWVNAYGATHFELIDSMVDYAGDRYAVTNLVDIRYTNYALVKGCLITHGRTGIKIDNAKNVSVIGNNICDLAVDGMTATPVTGLLVEGNHIHDLHQDRIKLKEYYWACPFTPASSNVTVQDALYSDLVVNIADGFTTGVAAYVNFATPQSCANLTWFGVTLTSSVSLASGDLAMRVSTAANGSTSGTYVDIPMGAGSIDYTLAKSITSAKSIALVVKTDKGACKLTMQDWQGSNGAHQDFVVFSGSDIVIRNNIFHDGCNQGIFTSPANGNNVTIENNLIYDIEGFNLLNISVSGNVVVRNNTLIGYYRGPSYSDPLNKYHFNGVVKVIANDTGAGFKVYNNLIAAELSVGGSGQKNYNIVTRDLGAVNQNLIISGTNTARVNFDTGFFDKLVKERYHGQNLGYSLTSSSAAVNFGLASQQPADSLGTLDSAGFIQANGPARNSTHHSAGAREYGSLVQPPPSPTNAAPVLAAIGNKSVAQGANLTFNTSATDSDSTSLTYSAVNLPTGATFTGQTFAWTPTSLQAGAYSVTFRVTDGVNSDSETITINVSNVNAAPVLSAVSPKTVTAGQMLTFALSASDPDGDALTYSASGMQTGAALTGTVFTWVPTLAQVGTYIITFAASDGQYQSSQQAVITVSAGTTTPPPTGTNTAPVLASIASKTIAERSLLTFTLAATDDDGDTITYAAQNKPAYSSFTGNTFSWRPTFDQQGTYSVTFTASDGKTTVSKTVTITVTNVNRPPVLFTIGAKSIAEGSKVSFTVKGKDDDGQTVKYTATGLPSGAAFTCSSYGTFTWTPTSTQAGTYKVTFKASDGVATDSEIVTITVSNS